MTADSRLLVTHHASRLTPYPLPLNHKRIFVAGATGMGGSAVVRRLLADYPEVSVKAGCFSREPFVEPDPRIEWVQADLRVKDDARRAAAGCDCAIMAAATTAGSRGMAAEPWRAVDDNVIMNTQMLEALHFEGVKRVVFVSTASVYQEFEGVIREDELDLNRDPHPAHFGVAWGARFIEKLCQFWREKTGMETLVARPANIYGPYAPFDPERSNVVPALIRKAVERMDPFEVWGSPDVVRDVIYADDFAAAIVAILASGKTKHHTFNVGTSVGVTVAEIMQWALDAAKHQPNEIRRVGDAPATTRIRLVDCSRIRDAVGWEPKHSVQEGICKTTQWWIGNRDTWTK